jgi:hypothetical protein
MSDFIVDELTALRGKMREVTWRSLAHQFFTNSYDRCLRCALVWRCCGAAVLYAVDQDQVAAPTDAADDDLFGTLFAAGYLFPSSCVGTVCDVGVVWVGP